VELLAADSQFESQAVLDLLDSLKISHIIAGRRLRTGVFSESLVRGTCFIPMDSGGTGSIS
jgi:hypothetical protein